MFHKIHNYFTSHKYTKLRVVVSTQSRDIKGELGKSKRKEKAAKHEVIVHLVLNVSPEDRGTTSQRLPSLGETTH